VRPGGIRFHTKELVKICLKRCFKTSEDAATYAIYIPWHLIGIHHDPWKIWKDMGRFGKEVTTPAGFWFAWDSSAPAFQ
jgi:hypothetical protein